MVALNAGRTAIVIPAENTVAVCVTPLFETRRSHSLTARSGTPIETTLGLACSSSPGKPARHLAIRVRYTETMCRIVSPDGVAQWLAMKMIEAVTVKERMVQHDEAAVPVGRPSPTAPSPTAPSTEIQSEIDARAPTEANINPRDTEAAGKIRR
jgi:hypothetical protein